MDTCVYTVHTDTHKFTCISLSHPSLYHETYFQIPGTWRLLQHLCLQLLHRDLNSGWHHSRGLPEHLREPCGGVPPCPAGGRLEGRSPGFLIEVELSQLLEGLGWQACCHQGTSKFRLAVLQLQGHVLRRPPCPCGCELPFQGGGCGGFWPQQ